MTTISLPPIVAAGTVTDSLGRTWDPLKHPRGRDGKFIHTFKRIRAFLSSMDTDPWMTGEVTKINDDGSIRVRIKKTTDPNLVDPASGKSYADAEVDITPDLVESINEKAVLGKDPNDLTPSVFSSMGYENEMTTWKSFRSRFFPDFEQGGSLGQVSLDSAIASLRDTLNNNESIEQWDADFKEKKGHDFVRDAAKYMIATRVLARSETLNGDDTKDVIHSNDKFRAVLEQLGVDPGVIDDTPDGLSGFDALAEKIRAWKSPTTGLDRAPRTPGAVREVEFGDDGNRVAIFGRDFGGPESPVSYKLVDKDGNIDPRLFNSFAETREAALEPKADLAPEPAGPTPPPEPSELDEDVTPEVDVEPTDADLDEIPDDTEQFTDIDTTDVRDIAQEIHLSDSEYGETYADSINGIASGVEEGSYSVEEARAELRSLSGEIGDEADDTGDVQLERLAKNLRAVADNLGVTKKADLGEPEDSDEEVLPDTVVNNPLEADATYSVKFPMEDFMIDDIDEWFGTIESYGLVPDELSDEDADDNEHFFASGSGQQINEFIAKNSALEYADPNYYVTGSDTTPEPEAPADVVDEPGTETVDVPEENYGPLTPLQAKHLENYAGMGARKLNKILRANESGNLDDIPGDTALEDASTTNVHEMTTTLDELIESQLEVGTYKQLYRGMVVDPNEDQDFIDSLVPGAKIVDRGFMSTSTNLDVAEQFADSSYATKKTVTFSVNVDEGQELKAINMDSLTSQMPGAYVMGEDEWLFGRNVQIVVDDVQLDKDGNYFVSGRLQKKDQDDTELPEAEADSEEESAPQDGGSGAEEPTDVDPGPGDSSPTEEVNPEVPVPDLSKTQTLELDLLAADEDFKASGGLASNLGPDIVIIDEDSDQTGAMGDAYHYAQVEGPGWALQELYYAAYPNASEESFYEKLSDPDANSSDDFDDPWADVAPAAPSIPEEPLAEWEKELLYGDDYVPPAAENDGQIVPFEDSDSLPGPDSEDWEKMVDVAGPYRWDKDGNKIGIGDKVVGADGVEMTISKFENNNKGVIALDAQGKKRIRHRKKLSLVAPESVPESAPKSAPEPVVDPATLPEPEPIDATPTGAMIDGASWKVDASTFEYAFQGFMNSAGDGQVLPNDYFYADDEYLITFNKSEQEYSLWKRSEDDFGEKSFEYIDGYPTSNDWPIHDDISAQIQETINAREKSLADDDDSDPVPADTNEPKILSQVDWNDESALVSMFKDANAAKPDSSWWKPQDYADLGQDYQLHYDPVDDVYEVHVGDTGEILYPPVGKPGDAPENLATSLQDQIKKHETNTSNQPSGPVASTVNNDDDFETSLAGMLDAITEESHEDDDKIIYGGYEVSFNRTAGNLELKKTGSDDVIAQVDVGEDFDAVVDVLTDGMNKNILTADDGDSEPGLDVPEPSGNMFVFSTWENDAETFAYDFEGFVNSVSDGVVEKNDYFDAGDGYSITHDPISNHFILWDLKKAEDDQLVEEIPNNNVAAATIQSIIKKRETEAADGPTPESSPAVSVYDSNAELAKINDIPKNLGGVAQLFRNKGLTAEQVKQYRNAGYALDDAKAQEVDSPMWNQAVNKAIYNLTQAGPEGAPKLAEVVKWRADSLNALHGGVIESDAPASGAVLPSGYAPLPDGTKEIYVHSDPWGSAVYAVLYDNDEMWYHYDDGSKYQVAVTPETLKNHPSWSPFQGTAVSTPEPATTPAPGPDLSKPHKLDMNGNAMFIGDKVYWATKGIDVTITGFENNDVGVIVTSVQNGVKKKHALNRKKLKLTQSVSQTPTQAPNKSGPPPVLLPNGPTTKKQDPDPSSPWFGKPEPKKPVLDEVQSLEGNKLVDDAWLVKANQNYKKGAKAENPNWVEKELSSSLTYNEYVSAQNGNKNALNNLLTKGWITQEMYDDALAQITAKNKTYEEALEKNNAKLSAWRKEMKAWRAANGLPTIQLRGMDDGVIKLNNSAAKAWMTKNQKPGALTPAGQLTGSSYSAVSSQKNSNISGALRAGKEKTLDPEWVAQNGGYHTLGMDQAMLDSPPLAEDFMVTRTLDMPNFKNPATGKPYEHNDTLSNIVGSIQHDWGFAETSVGSYEAGATVGYGSGRKIRMELRVPKGTRGVWTLHPSQSFSYDSERGFILERGLAYYIHSAEWNGSYWAVKAEVIPKDVNYDEFGHFINENPFFD